MERAWPFFGTASSRTTHEVYVKPIGADELVRLTDDPAPECCPSWSPDGRRIAFLRPRQTGAELILVPSSGGPEHTVGRLSAVGHKPCWSPNGEYIAVEDRLPGETRRIFLVSSATGEKRPVTNPPDGVSDGWPAFSPDGRTLAFARGNHQFAVYTVALARDGAPAAKPQRVTRELYSLGGLDWTPDGRDLVFGAYTEEVGWRLWKIRAGTKGTRPAPLPMRGWQPTFARRPPGSETRLAYVATFDDKNIYRVAGPDVRETTLSAEPAPERIVDSSRTDTAPRLSAAADKVVFVSGRSGHSEVWTVDADGSNPLQITRSGRSEVGSPSWSPDGRLIAFNGMPENNIDVYVVEAGGGVPRRLTIAPSNEGGAAWSRDGSWIYFMSDQTGRPEIWKMPPEGGQALQVTRNGGHQAVESPDGKWLYYSKSIKRPGMPESLPGEGAPGVFRMPVAGGEEEQVLEEGVYGRWALSRSGIYQLRSATEDRMPSIEWFRYDTWERKTLKTFPKHARFGMANSLTVASDDRWIVYAQYDHTASDLMLVEDY